MIIDLIPFNNKLDTLLMRLNCHDFVDKFYITEFRHNIIGQPKPLHIQDNWHLFERFKDRIEYRVYDKFPNLSSFQCSDYWRDLLLDEIRQLPTDTIVINTDKDEIIDSRKIGNYTGGVMTLEMSLYVYYLNLYSGRWINGTICTVDDLKDKKLSMLRYVNTNRAYEHGVLNNMGWHFSWLGGYKAFKEKYDTFGKQEGWDARLTDEAYVNTILRDKIRFWDKGELELVPIDGSYPNEIRYNLNKYTEHIYEAFL